MTQPDKKNHSIGIFDSGVGGLTVMKKVMEHLPQESIIYYGDTARVPYGSKSRSTITRYSIENTIFLLEKNIKALVVACHTASAFGLAKLRQIFNIPIIGVIEPSVVQAIQNTKNRRIAILGTRGTIESKVYQTEIQRRLPEADVIAIPCPLFVPLAEEQYTQHEATKIIVREYLAPVKEQGADTVLLGCTHYPLLQEAIQSELGPDVHLVDTGAACAKTLEKTLEKNQLSTTNPIGDHQFFVSDDPNKFQIHGEKFLGKTIHTALEEATADR